MIIHKAVFDLTIRVVVKCAYPSETHEDAIDAILVRALQDDIPPDLQTVGFVSAVHAKTELIHDWEEEK